MKVCDIKDCGKPHHAGGLCKPHYSAKWWTSGHPRKTNPWPPEKRARIAVMLRDGLSASQIGAQFKVSRNCIIGVVHRDKQLSEIGFARKVGERTGLPRAKQSRVPGVLAKPKHKPLAFNFSKKQTPLNFKPVPLPKPAPTPFECRSVPMMELQRGECKWAVNDAAPGEAHLFCGNPASGSYCARHAFLSVGRGTESERRAIRDFRYLVKRAA